ncbi:MAG: hypothetical protein COT74_12675 [Bdellovibrionales bacterium CG10_big_fil_rev_8_21_14_0_10_45_34]|nr:MAG: hypothetical protein COT74_12675 [Bdellovibrionales bacterium CG10_big_fil_rev_8_21_14_0_10_45_34]
MRVLNTTLILVFTLAGNLSVAANSPDEKSIQKILQDFVAASKPNRSVGSKGHKAAFEFLKKEFDHLAAEHSGSVYEHSFTPEIEFAVSNYKKDFETLVEGKISKDKPDYKKWKDFTDYSISFVQKYKGKAGRNLVLEFKGKKLPNEVVYVGAHFDTITHDHASMRFTPDSPTDGADDNASGIAALLYTAKKLAEEKHDRTVRIVAFDYEEVFFLGSYALAKDLKEGQLDWAPKAERYRGLFNLEMIGWSKASLQSRPTVKLYTRPDTDEGSKDDLVLAQLFDASVKSLKAKLKPQILKNGFNRSDNWSFWQKGFSAVCISQDWEGDFNEKNYHTDHDNIENLNLPYLT